VLDIHLTLLNTLYDEVIVGINVLSSLVMNMTFAKCNCLIIVHEKFDLPMLSQIARHRAVDAALHSASLQSNNFCL
jgi:hypothetical protein